jgi:hypothetical protein
MDPECLSQIAAGIQGLEPGTPNPQGHLDARKPHTPTTFMTL